MPDNEPSPFLDFAVIQDNESQVCRFLSEGNFLVAYLLVHTLIESLLRSLLRLKKQLSFDDLIQRYRTFLDQNMYPIPTFLDELVQFNRRRNRIIHQLWREGFTTTNAKVEPAARAAVIMYGLLIEWLGTFDETIEKHRFTLSK